LREVREAFCGESDGVSENPPESLFGKRGTEGVGEPRWFKELWHSAGEFRFALPALRRRDRPPRECREKSLPGLGVSPIPFIFPQDWGTKGVERGL
jgi:hypothetical protein